MIKFIKIFISTLINIFLKISLIEQVGSKENNSVEIEYLDVEIMQCNGGMCQSRIQEIKSELLGCERKIKEAKEQYHQSLIINLKKDAVIRQLEQNLKKLKFIKFRDVLGDETIESLNALSNSAETDSKFITIALRALYQENLLTLKKITYSGRGLDKEKLPQKDVELLKNIFFERLTGQTDLINRNNNFGKLVKTAIESINKAAK